METNRDHTVVGGGAADLSTAPVLGRARHPTLAIDADQRSNLPAHGAGGLLGPDGPPAAEATADADPTDLQAFWEAHYGKRERIWSGNPNKVLVDEVADLTPGTALDLGCGEGGDALWLAEQGWTVTGVDVSTTALARAAEEAERRGVAERIDWQQHDLGASFPEGSFDLVSAFFFHSPVEIPRQQVLRAAAAAVAPGGTLLVVGHAERPSWAPPMKGPDGHHVSLPTPEEVLAELDLRADEWDEPVLATPERSITAPDSSAATIRDSVVRLRRRG